MIAGALLLGAAMFTLFGQTTARPKFEVASIKPSQEMRFQSVRPLPGRLTANATVKLLIQNAYSVEPFQIQGGPDWINSERFEIEAKADSNAPRAQIFLMLQSLLEDRFQMKIHRETRELPVYALVAAKSGPKLAAPKEGSCISATPDPGGEWGGGRMAPPTPGRMTAPAQCGAVRIMLEPSGARLSGGKITMAEFVRMLSMALGRAVIDRTGVTAPFDLQLTFQPDEITAAVPPPPPGSGSPDEARYPSIVTALQEQLGLRLESTKGPVDTIVIDSATKPAAN